MKHFIGTQFIFLLALVFSSSAIVWAQHGPTQEKEKTEDIEITGKVTGGAVWKGKEVTAFPPTKEKTDPPEKKPEGKITYDPDTGTFFGPDGKPIPPDQVELPPKRVKEGWLWYPGSGSLFYGGRRADPGDIFEPPDLEVDGVSTNDPLTEGGAFAGLDAVSDFQSGGFGGGFGAPDARDMQVGQAGAMMSSGPGPSPEKECPPE